MEYLCQKQLGYQAKKRHAETLNAYCYERSEYEKATV